MMYQVTNYQTNLNQLRGRGRDNSHAEDRCELSFKKSLPINNRLRWGGDSIWQR